jgi:hypothetical protein
MSVVVLARDTSKKNSSTLAIFLLAKITQASSILMRCLRAALRYFSASKSPYAHAIFTFLMLSRPTQGMCNIDETTCGTTVSTTT